jgi:hypothetical protein
MRNARIQSSEQQTATQRRKNTMTRSEAPLQPVLGSTPPAVVTRNATEFYAFSEVNFGTGNFIQATTYINNTWTQKPLTGFNGYVTSATAPATNGSVQSIVVGSTVFVVYQTSATALGVIKGSVSSWDNTTPALSFAAVNNFQPFTDGTSLYVLVNDNNTLKYVVLNGSTWSTVVLTGSTGRAPNALTPLTSSPLSATFFNGNIRCAYFGGVDVAHSNEVVEVHGAPQVQSWAQRTLIAVSGAKGLNYFIYNGFLFCVFTYADGDIDVYWYNAGKTPVSDWEVAYESVAQTPPPPQAAMAPAVAVVNNGVFICYPDSSGNLQVTFFLGYFWATAQLTGPGSSILPSAPLTSGTPGVTVYAVSSLHICYVTKTNGLEDAFFVPFSWYQQELYPKLPGS